MNKWWVKTIRSLNWFAWRYWWFIWLLFILSILMVYFFCPSRNKINAPPCNEFSEIRRRIQNLNESFSSCCECNLKTRDTIPKLDSNEIYLPADFILITYQFDKSGGKDLDTRTNIESPNQSSVLGFCKSKSASNIVWSDDNTGFGVESVYIDINKYNSDDIIVVLCKAFWYSQRNSGNMSLDIRAYKGGKMKRDKINHFQFINVGGEMVGNVISFPKNIEMKGPKCLPGETIGRVKYNRKNQALSFE